MSEFLARGHNLQHALAALILVSRVGDVVSTLLVSPTLQLESNPIARRFFKVVAVLSFAFCLIPYYNAALAVMVLVPSLLVSASNLGRGWVARALGEGEFLAMVERAATRSTLGVALTFTVTSGMFIILAGLVLLVLSGGQTSWGYWFAIGIILYGIAMAFYGSLFTARIFQRVHARRQALLDLSRQR
jgi:hypothetical protein